MLISNIVDGGHSLALTEWWDHVLCVENIQFFSSELQRKTKGNTAKRRSRTQALQMKLFTDWNPFLGGQVRVINHIPAAVGGRSSQILKQLIVIRLVAC